MVYAFLISTRQLTVNHQPITLPGGHRAYIRVIRTPGEDMGQALDTAFKGKDRREYVMNSHDLDDLEKR